MTSLTGYIVGILLLMLAVGSSMVITNKLQHDLKIRRPNARPYQWGYFIGCMGFWFAPATLGLSALFGWGIIKRRRWAWVAGTILSFNPFAWLINAIYIAHRWQEFSGEAAASNRSFASDESSSLRVWLNGDKSNTNSSPILIGAVVLILIAVAVIAALPIPAKSSKPESSSTPVVTPTAPASSDPVALGAIPLSGRSSNPAPATGGNPFIAAGATPVAAPDPASLGFSPATVPDPTAAPTIKMVTFYLDYIVCCWTPTPAYPTTTYFPGGYLYTPSELVVGGSNKVRVSVYIPYNPKNSYLLIDKNNNAAYWIKTPPASYSAAPGWSLFTPPVGEDPYPGYSVITPPAGYDPTIMGFVFDVTQN